MTGVTDVTDTGASLSLGAVVVRTAASPDGESLPDGASPGLASLGVTAAGSAGGATVRGCEPTTRDRLGAAAESNSSRESVVGAAGASTGPARSCSSSRPRSCDSTYTRSSGAELGLVDSTLATPIVRKTSRCTPAEAAPAQTMRRSGDSAAKPIWNASTASGAAAFSSADVGTLSPRVARQLRRYSRRTACFSKYPLFSAAPRGQCDPGRQIRKAAWSS